MSSLKKLKKMYDEIKDNRIVNIFGPLGVGKTWMAKRVSDRSTRDKSFDFTLWVFMCRDYNIESLSESIGRQLCLLPDTEEWEAVDESEGVKVVGGKVENSETLIDRIKRKLEGSRILLVLDDVPDDKTKSMANINNFWSVWREIFPAPENDEKLHRVIISKASTEDEVHCKVEVEALEIADSISLLTEKLDARLRQSKKIQDLGEIFIKKSNHLPATVIMIAKSLNYFCQDASGVSMLEKELEKASETYSVSKLLYMKCDVLLTGVLKDLCWIGNHFFRDSGSVHYNELIAYWILEGYLGSGSMTKLYEKGHEILIELRDCGILKEQESGYLSMDKLSFNFDALDHCSDQIASLGLAKVFARDTGGFGRIAHDDGILKTPRTVKKGKNKEHSGSSEESGQSLLTLMLDGTYFSEEVLERLIIKHEKELITFALFNPNIKKLPVSLDEMKNLCVLVLRGCAYLEDINLSLANLRVLEISGARSLSELKPEFFTNMTELQSLYLSELLITSLPRSFYNLSKLQWLVIKDCPHLKKVDSLSKLNLLTVLDLSGNISLDYVNKDFLEFKNLLSLNLSNTMVLSTPLFRNVGELTHLLLHNCKNLGRLRSLISLRKLRTLDLSGSSNFEEFYDLSLENLVSLDTLDLSGTTLDRLPFNIGNPRHLYLKSCLQLQELWCIGSLVRLEELDLSGSKNLSYIEDEFFNPMGCLRVLNLSETKVSFLPSLSNLSNLRELFLSCCSFLKALPSLESVTKLEVLDVSRCTVLEDIQISSFERMTSLRKLDLSETIIKRLPALSNLSNLRQLLLKNCTTLQNLELTVSLLNLEVLNLAGIISLAPDGVEVVKDMSNLKVLDLTGTSLEQLPSMWKLKNLIYLSLAGCRHLQSVPDLNHQTKLEVLDLSGTPVKRLPNLTNSKNLHKLLLKDCVLEEDVADIEVKDLRGLTSDIPRGISALSHVDYVVYPIPNIQGIQGVERSLVKGSTEEITHDQWNICQLSDIDTPPLFHSGTQFLQILKNIHSPQLTFHLCAFPVMAEGETEDRYLRRHELVFSDVYFKTKQFSDKYKGNGLLQIRGFNHSPKGIEKIIGLVNMVFLIDNKFKSLLSSLTESVLNKLKGCWIERCDKMVSIFNEKERKDDTKSGISLEDLGVSNSRALTSIYNGARQLWIFDRLKTLYIDGCPNLTTVFPSSWLPKTLKVLQIKYCDNIVSLFETEGHELPNLETLQLWELPELKSIGISFPSLKNLHICGATSLKSLYAGNQESHNNFMKLETLKLESCPMLENVISSNLPLEKIRVIEIRYCEKLQTLVAHNNSVDYNLSCLNKLHLEDLQMLKSIGVTLPSQLERDIINCPNLYLIG